MPLSPPIPSRDRPAETPWPIVLLCLLEYAENLSDGPTADAVRSRTDWNHMLGLDLTVPGFDATVLYEFPTRILTGGAEEISLSRLLETGWERKWLTARGRQRTDSTDVLGFIHAMNRLECVGETMPQALNSLAAVAPDWLKLNSHPKWVERYAKPMEDYRLPKSKQARQIYAQQIGADSHRLLDLIYAPRAPAWLSEVHRWSQCDVSGGNSTLARQQKSVGESGQKALRRRPS